MLHIAKLYKYKHSVTGASEHNSINNLAVWPTMHCNKATHLLYNFALID